MASSYHEKRMAEQLEEEARLEALMMGADQEEQVLDNGDVVAPEESTELKIELTDDLFKEVTVPEDTLMKPTDGEVVGLRKQLADEKHRYNRYKGSTDQTLFTLRKENAELVKQVATLRAEIASMPSVKPVEQEAFSQDVVDVLGEDAVDAIKKSQSQVAQELADLKKQQAEREAKREAKRAEQLEADNQRDFMRNLEALVPDLEAMNNDNDFNDWLREADETGVERLVILRDDQDRYDYRRVAEFFIKYKKLKTGGPTEVTDDINQHIGPTSKNTAQSNKTADPRTKGFIKQSEINAFNTKVSKGEFKYFPEKAEAFENKVFKAMNEGKIILDVKPNI